MCGYHSEKSIYTAITKKRLVLDCVFEDQEVDPHLFISQIGNFLKSVRDKMVSIVQLWEEIDKSAEWAEYFISDIGSLISGVYLSSIYGLDQAIF